MSRGSNQMTAAPETMTPAELDTIAQNGRMGAIAGEQWRDLMNSVLHRGFFGAAQLIATIEDGRITTVRTAEERTHK